MKWYHWAIIAILLSGGGVVVYNKTRGLRNKNPGNIRYNPSNDWKGQTGKDSAGFVIFSEYKYGVRAMGKTIRSYQNRGVRTVRQIIETWAPSNENDTESYIKSVERQTGYADWYIPQSWLPGFGGYVPLVMAIIKHENGINPFDEEQISDWINLE